MLTLSKAICFGILILFLFPQASEAQRVRLEARLTGDAIMSGKAKFEQRRNRMKFNVEVEDSRAKATFDVFAQRGGETIPVGKIRTNRFGFGEIDVDNTEGDMVERLQVGDRIIIKSANRTVLSGVLRRR